MTIGHASLSSIQDVGRLMRRKLQHRNAKPVLELRVLYTLKANHSLVARWSGYKHKACGNDKLRVFQ